MKFILRLDIDKPYGNHTFPRKLLSKFIEETNVVIKLPNYLDHVEWMVGYLKPFGVKAIFYFRNCTAPHVELLELLISEGHAIGFHAENTKTFETFQSEILLFQEKVKGVKLHSFTKHGSGQLKLGKNHYPPYEPQKYLEWAQKVGVPFYFGNDLFSDSQNDLSAKKFFPENFWIELAYRDVKFKTVNTIQNAQKQREVFPIISHPENIIRDYSLRDEFKSLCEFVVANGFRWMTPQEFLNE